MRILVTGATGNVGLEIVRYLLETSADAEISVAIRNSKSNRNIFKDYPNLAYRHFDFENEATYSKALDRTDILFLLRPPHISDVEKIFLPLLSTAQKVGINKIVFLSVQGAEKSRVLPHNKIERLIQKLRFNYIFVRPSYFMQNLTTTLLPEIMRDRRITLPSGKAKFNWVDVKNIGEATAKLILQFEEYQNRAYVITGTENRTFENVASLMSETTGESIKFKNINPISFYFRKRKEGVESAFAVVMTMLHFLPRLQAEPKVSDDYQKLTRKRPTTLREFIEREKEKIKTL